MFPPCTLQDYLLSLHTMCTQAFLTPPKALHKYMTRLHPSASLMSLMSLMGLMSLGPGLGLKAFTVKN